MCIRDSITTGALELIQQACANTTALYQGHEWIREYAFQDRLFHGLLKVLPPTAHATAQAKYTVTAEYHTKKHSVNAKGLNKRGRVDICVGHGHRALYIEIKLDKSQARDLTESTSTETLDGLHSNQVKEAAAQVCDYQTNATNVVRVALSVVWCWVNGRRELVFRHQIVNA
eukprot:TRINITY_DN4622_c0_g1_i1.p1 TRINITY_DN4622_c0_g1~~TRINITY_DN4622_c0_g1_i1.p1  ORF type:complete len:172 (-),score=12.07 TRINITY_DN4622_c0_g1_i1:223-738(-)